MRFNLIYTDKIRTKDHLIFLADKNDLKGAKTALSASDFKLLQAYSKKDVPFVVFQQENRVVTVEFLPTIENADKEREAVRLAGCERLKLIKHYKTQGVHIFNLSKRKLSLPFIEGLLLGNYQFLKYFKDIDKRKSSLKDIRIDSSCGSRKSVTELSNIVEATCQSRDLVNEPLSYLTAPQLSKEFVRMGKEAGFSVKVLGKKAIENLGMGGLLAVNLGSYDPPTFSILEWKPKNAKNKKPIVLVGKGVVYDTGGMSLKPTGNSMDFMKSDMGGAAAAAGIMYATAKNKLPLHIIALIPATDNRPGKNAYVPGDVIKMYSGTTVEVLNTDAEGRMILADALHYAKKYKPQLVMDFATLTGAAARAVGPHACSVMGTDTANLEKVKQSGFNVYERLVEFPLWDEYGDLIKSEIADIKNLGGPSAGMITAGKFLQHFTDYPWIHFDIAGGAFQHNGDGYRLKGGTGVGVRLIYDFLKTYK